MAQTSAASTALRGDPVIEKSASIAPTKQDNGQLILWIVDKRIRTWRKKLEKIQALEEKVAGGAKINDQQAAVLQNKEPSKVVLAELQKLRALLAEETERLQANGQVTPATTEPSNIVLAELQKVRALLAEETEKQEANGQVIPATTEPSKVVVAELQKLQALLSEETKTLEATEQVTAATTEPITHEVVEANVGAVSETTKDDTSREHGYSSVENAAPDSALDSVIELFQCARLFQPFLPGSEDIREEFLKSQAGNVSASDLDALQFACSLVDGSGNPFGTTSLSDRISEAMKHARAYIDGSEKELTYAVTYRRVREIVSACRNSSMFATEPMPEPESSVDVPHINFMVEDMTTMEQSNHTQ